jgi:disulfide bond formation protein DsbB
MRNDLAAALLVGCASAALLLGALAFQFGKGLPPCEMCIWQRWPHLAAAIIGLGGGLLVGAKIFPARAATVLALLAIAAIAIASGLGVFHAGVEWKWWEGPEACTLSFSHGAGINFEPIPATRCDEAAWRLFGISLAGYNALISFAVAAAALFIVCGRKETRA